MLKISLTDAVVGLKQQLLEAKLNTRESDPLRLSVERVELELSVHIERSQTDSGKFEAWVVSVGTEGHMRSADIHKIKVSLLAFDKAYGNALEIGRENVPTSTE